MTTDHIPYWKDGSPRGPKGFMKILPTDRLMRFEDARNIRRLYALMIRKRASLIHDKDATAEDWQNAFEEAMNLVVILEQTSEKAYGEVTAPPPKKLA